MPVLQVSKVPTNSLSRCCATGSSFSCTVRRVLLVSSLSTSPRASLPDDCHPGRRFHVRLTNSYYNVSCSTCRTNCTTDVIDHNLYLNEKEQQSRAQACHVLALHQQLEAALLTYKALTCLLKVSRVPSIYLYRFWATWV